MCISCCKNHITKNTSIYNLRSDIFVDKSCSQTIFWGIVLVLVLVYKTVLGPIVCLALSPSLELNLKSLEVGHKLLSFNENHGFELKNLQQCFEAV